MNYRERESEGSERSYKGQGWLGLVMGNPNPRFRVGTLYKGGALVWSLHIHRVIHDHLRPQVRVVLHELQVNGVFLVDFLLLQVIEK